MDIKTRRDDLIVKELDGDLVVYDPRDHLAHELNATAACVWRNAEAASSLEDLAALVACETGLPADPEIVTLALSQLSTAGLVELGAQKQAPVPTRREVIARLGLTGGLAVALPAVTSLVAPTAAMAQSVPDPRR
jgi:hypothetical protein